MQPYALVAIATLGVWMAGSASVQAYSINLTAPTAIQGVALTGSGVDRHPPLMTQYAADRHPPVMIQYAADRHPPLLTQYAADRHPPVMIQYAADRHPPLLTQYAADRHPPLTTRYADLMPYGLDRHPPLGQEPIQIVLQFGTETNNFVLSPKTLKLEEGKPYRLVIANRSQTAHFVSAPEFGAAIDSISLMRGVTLEKGHRAVWYFVANRAGTYDVGCGIQAHKKAGMVGKIIVS